MKGIVLAAVLVLFNYLNASIAFSAKAGIAPQNTNCVRDYRKWLKRPGWKAVAVNNVQRVNGQYNQSCGMSWSAPTKEHAIKGALLECKKALPRKSRKNTCHVTETAR